MIIGRSKFDRGFVMPILARHYLSSNKSGGEKEKLWKHTNCGKYKYQLQKNLC